MDSDNLILISSLFFLFILTALIVFAFIFFIPTGHEMGAIGEAFLAISYAITIYFFTILISLYFWKTAGDKRGNALIIIYSISLLAIVFSSWRICIYEKPMPTKEDSLKIKLERDAKLYTLYTTIPELKQKGDIYRPEKWTYYIDSSAIIDFINGLIKPPYEEMDSSIKINISKLLDFNKETIFENSTFTINYIGLVKSSIKINDIFYSPQREIIVTIVSYNQSNGGDAFILIGRKYQDHIKLYKYYNTRNADYPNAEIAYAACFEYLNSHSKGILNKSFWTKNILFKIHNIENTDLYGFQVKSRYKTDTLKIKQPLFEVKQRRLLNSKGIN